MSTKEELAAENERLGKEVAALRALLAAVRDLADVPRPADLADSAKCDYTAGRRIDLINVYADPDCNGRPARTATLHSSAEALRKEAAKPLPYAPKAAAPVITDSERDCDQANPETGAWCHRGGDHGVHRDADGDEWRTDTIGGLLLPADCDPDNAPVRVGVPERIPTPASHYCDSGNCEICGDGTGDETGVDL